jgi:hypothetical protein
VGERPDSHHRFEPDPDPEWEPDIRRVTVVIDADFSVVAMQPDIWVRYRLARVLNELDELGIMATPVRIEIEGWSPLT